MTEKDTKHYTSDFFVLRTPLLPVEDLLWWSNGLIAPELDDSSPEKLEQALARDRSVLRARLKTLIERAEVREAIFVASPGLEERIPTWLTNPASADGVRVERALVKYLMRMITRSTPFGLFSGCSIGRVGDQTDIRLKSRTEYQRHTRLDMVLLSNVCTQLNANPAVRHELRFYPNSTLRRLGRTWRYIETRGSYKGGLSHHLVETPTTEHLEIVFAAAQGGATIETLACALVDSDRDVSSEEAEAFVIELIDNDLLVSTLTPNLTGPESAQELVSRLATLTSAQSAYCLLSAANDSLRELDAAGLGVDPNRYRMICARVENALGIPVAPEGTFLTDLWKPVVDAVIGTNIVRELERGLPILQAMSYLKRTSDLQRSMQISRFQEAFVERYGEQEIPLLEALDDDTGLEFGPSGPDGRDLSLLDGLRFPPRSEAPTYSWDHTLQSLLRNVQDAIATGSNEIEVSPSDFQAVAQSADPLPDSFYLMATVLAASERTLKENDYRILVQSGFGPSAARILGRFALTSQELTLVLNDHLRLEEGLSPDAVFAEIVHFPGARVGNILCRPAFRSYDITYLGRSGRPEHEQLPASDLLVSTVGGRTVLRSARLGKRVIPRLTSAHHYEAPQLVKTYRFLCAIQDEGLTTNLSWWWGPLAASAFLPRVVSGRLVLSRARWRLGEAEISKLKTIRSGPLYQHIVSFRQRCVRTD